MTAQSHDDRVRSQFGPRAGAYLNSPVHAVGADLDEMARRIGERPQAAAIDVGCGGGHVSFRLAPQVGRVVACDLSAEMLSLVAEEAERRGLANLSTRRAAAEALPFADATFDLAVSRLSAHHWRDVPAGLAQIRRVLKPDGLAIFMDVVSSGDPLFDTWLQGIELLRDPSHVRDYSIAEWQTMLRAAGFAPEPAKEYPMRLEFRSWVERMNTPEPHVRAIRSLQGIAADEVVRHFAIETDGSFSFSTMLIVARAV
jgi:ubiquinone/menaquinone biosynthesis C-methylase UbiE